jgi:predicted DNA-binding transcriptional regulator AlpA
MIQRAPWGEFSNQSAGIKMTYLTFADLRAKLGNRGRTTIYRDVELGRLPKPRKIGSRLYWADSEIDAAMSAAAE